MRWQKWWILRILRRYIELRMQYVQVTCRDMKGIQKRRSIENQGVIRNWER